MDKGKIFLNNPSGDGLIPMTETKYTEEAILQALVANIPDMLPGDQINPERPRRWLLVREEMGVADAPYAGDRWSLDHLFLEQDGIPTFVEIKRSQDTRIRREVVAQMLEYAANGTMYWSVEKVRQAAAETAVAAETDLDAALGDLIDAEDAGQIEAYWKQVEENLRDGRVRLLFVADEIPKELRRLAEFLNEKLKDVEVLAVEIKQFQGAGQTAWVPRLIGQTEAIREQKSTGQAASRSYLNWETFAELLDAPLVSFYERFIADIDARGLDYHWGTYNLIVSAPAPSSKSFIYANHERVEFYLKYMQLTALQYEELRELLEAYDLYASDSRWTYRAFFSQSEPTNVWEIYQKFVDMVTELIVESNERDQKTGQTIS